ncbi:hypothetical protein [Fibrobacter sp. UWEL]|uniref:hypothetical protein n=1 Tax=Fibrobacter sp. UWEL TaxID=1896209 RepID=UPI0009202BEB|nr:hypothetical protein [Fibrobacter sp. UWEL]SHK48438.1 hypothetical protein SAMN05720468_102204 [Fibrobacter sp. UWEL]
MSENASKQKLPSQIIFENLKELLRAKNTAHESMFKFHWKKMWPFCLIWPQVDFERIVRLMSELRKNVINQKNLLAQAKGKSKDFEKTFLNAVPAYLDALDVSCKFLGEAAQWKQDMLLKRIHKDVKFKRDVAEWSRILKDYETAQGNLTRAGAFVQMGWQEFVNAGGFVADQAAT